MAQAMIQPGLLKSSTMVLGDYAAVPSWCEFFHNIRGQSFTTFSRVGLT